MAPARVPVELRWERGDHRRVFRLSSALDDRRILFSRDISLPEGEPATARFALPGDARVINATVEIAEREARFLALDGTDRARIAAYVKERLVLP